ncbi:MAG: alpha/beta hydrolase [Pseudomonadota bacterium]
MSLDQVRKLKEALAARPKDVPLEARRDGFEGMMAQVPLATGISSETVDGPVSGIWLDPHQGRTEKVILHVHGGAFVLGSAQSYKPFCSELAQRSGISVFALDYPLAPENPFPAGLNAVAAALEWMHDVGFTARNLGLSGDSAGGNLALAALQANQDTKAGALYLLSPYLDLTHSGASIKSRGARDPFVVPSTMPQTKATYCGDEDASDARISPLFGDMHHIPKTLIQVGSDETLFDDAKRLEAALLDAGKAPIFQEWAGMMHVWPLFAHQIEEGQWALAQAASFFAQALAP